MGNRTIIAPDDEHNRRLIDNVHPSDWINPTPDGRYNLISLGGGSAGLVAAIGAAGLGAKVALVEKHLLGGDCLNFGCVPSKALIRSARAAFEVADAASFGVHSQVDRIDFEAVMSRVRKIRADISPHDSAKRFSEELGVDIYLGEGRFTGRDTLEVGGTELRFARAVIATGGSPLVLPIPGLTEAGFLTNLTMFELTELPPRVAVIGGGPIGCEMAQSFARLGSTVHIIEINDRIMHREDPDASALVSASFERDGIDFRLQVKMTEVRHSGDVKTIVFEDGRQIEVDQILVAIGRRPNVEGIGLEAAGVEFGRRGVKTDDFLCTTNPRIYASGDVTLKYQFTHTADFASRAILQNALFAIGPFGRKRVSDLLVPWCTFTDPEVAHVGFTPHDPDNADIDYDEWTVPFAGVDRAIAEGETEGFCRIYTAKGSDRILGGTMVARHAGEMISEISVAIRAGMGLGALASVIHPYPTTADAIRKAGDLYNKTRLTPMVAKIFKTILAWKR